MSYRTQNFLALAALAIALMVGSCESLRLGASVGRDASHFRE